MALIRCLGMIQDQIEQRSGNSSQISEPVSSTQQPSIKDAANTLSGEIDKEKELKLALGLLLKHRGGPGFGHGRLQGKELLLLESKLKSAVRIMREEAVSVNTK